jgi:hypothetical protein
MGVRECSEFDAGGDLRRSCNMGKATCQSNGKQEAHPT